MTRVFALLALVVAAVGCSRSAPDLHASAPAPLQSARPPSIAGPMPRSLPRASTTALRHATAPLAEPTAPWLAELLNAPDPQVRLQGLELWARYPGESLDPVTYALVDPDDEVRQRAQELFEQELARR